MTNGKRPDDHLDALLRPSSYNPRRRRQDTIVAGTVGFLVGALAGLATLGVVIIVAWLSAAIVGFVGWLPFILAVMVIGGISLAIGVVRSSQ